MGQGPEHVCAGSFSNPMLVFQTSVTPPLDLVYLPAVMMSSPTNNIIIPLLAKARSFSLPSSFSLNCSQCAPLHSSSRPLRVLLRGPRAISQRRDSLTFDMLPSGFTAFWFSDPLFPDVRRVKETRTRRAKGLLVRKTDLGLARCSVGQLVVCIF